jgi:hypothetical protein
MFILEVLQKLYQMIKRNSGVFLMLSIVFSMVMNLPLENGLGLFALVMLALPLIFAACSLTIYFLLISLDEEFRLIATILACCINIYCGLMLRFDLPVPFE